MKLTENGSIDSYEGALIGLACGDAVGSTLEFRQRDKFPLLTDMVGGGKFKLSPGEWTDDTSMTMCLAESLIESNGFDAGDQMKRYLRWANNGHFSCKSYGFGIGKTVIQALTKFDKTSIPYSGSSDPNTAGNGSLMRLAPVSLYYYPEYEKVIYYAGESSKTTHMADECIQACQVLAHIQFNILRGKDKNELLFDFEHWRIPVSNSLKAIIGGSYTNKHRDEIASSGYVVDSLEAALWSFFTTNSFEEAILRAANLADDADTVAAICGQVAGMYYGFNSIPTDWVNKLAMRDEILAMAKALYQRAA
jgi:ADP-ribosyl-[dinitrogen reductase] hydrolase